MLLGNIVITIFGKHFNSSKGIFYSWFGVAVALIGLAILNVFYTSLCWALLLGINAAILNTSIVIILQKTVSTTFRARVFGGVGAVAQVGMPLSLFVLSYIIKRITISEIFTTGAIVSCVFAIFWWYLVCHSETTMQVDHNSHQESYEDIT